MHWKQRRMRRPAANELGHAHELTLSCFRGFPFLRAERTCLWLADAMNASRREFGFSLWAYVFMPEHVHLLLCPQRHDYEIAVVLKATKRTVGIKAIKFLAAPHRSGWNGSVSNTAPRRSGAFGRPAADSIETSPIRAWRC